MHRRALLLRALHLRALHLRALHLPALALSLVATACGDDDGGLPAAACDMAEPQHGDGTYYAATGAGACSFDASSGGELLVAAMNAPQFDGSSACGMCAHVVGPRGEVTVRIVDLCPECARGDLDLSPDAFDRIAERSAGRVPITWREVPCDVGGAIAWRLEEGSNPWWTAVQVRDHRHRVARVEARDERGEWVELPRVEYNFFVADNGLGEGPYALRAIDVYGNVVEDEAIALIEARDQRGGGQFPECE